MKAHNLRLTHRAQLGEYLGHHEDFALAVMYAYIDAERFGGLSIDAALRVLLAGFRLPGAAPCLTPRAFTSFTCQLFKTPARSQNGAGRRPFDSN